MYDRNVGIWLCFNIPTVFVFTNNFKPKAITCFLFKFEITNYTIAAILLFILGAGVCKDIASNNRIKINIMSNFYLRVKKKKILTSCL